MNLEFIQTKQQIACCFMKDGGRIFEGPGFKNYIPLLNELEFQTTTDLKMVHKKDVCNNIETYDENNSNKKLSPGVKEAKKIDVTMGDINITPTQILFNFTDFDIVSYNSHNFPMTLPKLESKTLKDLFRGNIVLMTVYRLNNPNRVIEVTGIDKNYLVDILDKNKHRNRNNSRFSNFLNVIEYAQQCWEEIDYFKPEYKCNNITVVTFTILSGEVFLFKDRNTNTQQYQSVLLTEHDILLTRDSVFQHKDNPCIDRHMDISGMKGKIFDGSKFIYLIDKDNHLEDRYYISYGDIEKIPKITNGSTNHQPDGLYIGRYNANLGVTVDQPIPLDKIDTLDYVYRTVEEAKRGADKAELYNQELKEREARIRERELELKNINVVNKTEYESMIHNLRIENEEIKAKATKELQQHEAEFLKFKRSLESSSLREKTRYENDGYSMKHYFDERKHRYDDVKYERETFVESLKTVAATAGVLATGFMIYKQLNKAS